MVINDDILVSQKYPQTQNPYSQIQEEDDENEKVGIWELFQKIFEEKKRKDTGKLKSEY